MTLSRKTIESLKIALAVTIAMGIALYMDWEQPRWAAINIALASMATIGQSFNNAIERILGTTTAGLMTLALVAIFGQDRWLYVLALSVWMGVCTYMMGGKKLEGFWMMAGFATAIIATDAGIDLETSVDSFEAVMLRLQQTLLGLLVYTFVMVLVWPHDGYAEFRSVNRKLHEAQHRLYRIYVELMHGQLHSADKTAVAGKLRMQSLQQSIRAWQERIQETFQFMSADPTAGNSEKFRAGLSEIVENLEARIKETLNTTSKGRLDPRDSENIYRLLGAYRSVSGAMGDYVASTDAIHWSRWKEERI